MLTEIRVSHFAIIQNLKISFQPGLNILSGETGAGKSVLLKSLSLLMGEKATTDLVSDRAEMASVEGLFKLTERPDIIERLKEMDLPAQDEELIVRRVVSREGASRVYLNGSLTTLQTLRELVFPLVEVTQTGAPLIEMTGQHESKNLMSRHYHLDLLDRYCEAGPLRAEYEAVYNKRAQVLAKIQELEEGNKDRDQRLDYLKFQLEQISTMDLQPGEDETLLSQIKLLKAGAKLQSLAQSCEQTLIQDEGSAQARLRAMARLCADFGKTNEKGAQWSESLYKLAEQMEECVFQIQSFSQAQDFDPKKISQMEERLSAIRTLQKRYGPSIDDILSQQDQLQEDVDALMGLGETLQKCKKDLDQYTLSLKSLGEKLTARRLKGAKNLQTAVNKELLGLNMKGVTVLISVENLSQPTASGYDSVELLLKSSEKAQPKPLRRVGSGGELSRVLLALKSTSGDQDTPRTYLFDEVDTGVSGETAQKVGRRLKSIAKGQQVICITHLPQVAACADHHFFIKKTLREGLASMEVKRLSEKDRVKEVARLLSGESVTVTALKNAQELLAL